jgi:hypothetical protein
MSVTRKHTHGLNSGTVIRSRSITPRPYRAAVGYHQQRAPWAATSSGSEVWAATRWLRSGGSSVISLARSELLSNLLTAALSRSGGLLG